MTGIAEVSKEADDTKMLSSALSSKTEEKNTYIHTYLNENVFARRFVLVDSTNDLKQVIKRKKEFHLFAFICPFRRYTKERKKFLKEISKISKTFFERSVLIFTQCAKEQTLNLDKEIHQVLEMDELLKTFYKKAPHLFCPTDLESYSEFRREFVDKLVDIVIERFTKKTIQSEMVVHIH